MDGIYPLQPRASARRSSIRAEPAITVLAVARYASVASDPGAQADFANALESTGSAVMGSILNSGY